MASLGHYKNLDQSIKHNNTQRKKLVNSHHAIFLNSFQEHQETDLPSSNSPISLQETQLANQSPGNFPIFLSVSPALFVVMSGKVWLKKVSCLGTHVTTRKACLRPCNWAFLLWETGIISMQTKINRPLCPLPKSR